MKAPQSEVPDSNKIQPLRMGQLWMGFFGLLCEFFDALKISEGECFAHLGSPKAIPIVH
ncbi:hypothetical protein D3C78_1763660 [compost metagenome]